MFPFNPKLILRWGGYAFITAGVLALSYVGYAFIDSKLYQLHEQHQFQQAISDVKGLPVEGKKSLPMLVPVARETPEHNADIPSNTESVISRVGRIDIKSVGLSAIILEGTDDATLRRGVGHVTGSALPGQNGNVAIAGHRDTFFRALRDIHTNAEIILTTIRGSYRYRVVSTDVVDPHDAEVLDESDDPSLTLITCYPFNFVGSAPQRFIVTASKVSGN